MFRTSKEAMKALRLQEDKDETERRQKGLRAADRRRQFPTFSGRSIRTRSGGLPGHGKRR
jgi:hypothetical protein